MQCIDSVPKNPKPQSYESFKTLHHHGCSTCNRFTFRTIEFLNFADRSTVEVTCTAELEVAPDEIYISCSLKEKFENKTR